MKMKYDTKTLEGKIAVMERYKEDPEGLYSSHTGWQKHPITSCPTWDWHHWEYNYPASRKRSSAPLNALCPPASALVPWTFETCPKGVVLLKYTIGFGVGIT